MRIDKDRTISNLRFELEMLESVRVRDNAYLLDKIRTLQEALAPFANAQTSTTCAENAEAAPLSSRLLQEEDFIRARRALKGYPRVTEEAVATQQQAANG